MSIFVKICGLRTAEAIEAAVEAGADALGFVFAASPRRVSVAEAKELTRGIPPGVLRVAVMHHPTQQEWDAVARGFEPDWLQTDSQDFADLDIGAEVRPLPVYRDRTDLDTDAIAAEERVLFEAPASGQGQRADWDRAAELAARTRLMLAGGLTPDNVGSAIVQVRPWGVDVSSGVERRRGEKDPERIAAFIQAVRKTETVNAG
jgi:phosphoribosylanthranilate isomerase